MIFTIKVPTKTSRGTEYVEVLKITMNEGIIKSTITSPSELEERTKIILQNFQEGFEFQEKDNFGIKTLSFDDGLEFLEALLASSNAYFLVEQS